MSEDMPEPDGVLSGLIPDAEPPVIPNPKASQPKRTWFPKAAGDRRDTNTRTKPKKAPVPKARPGHFVEPLTQIYAGLGMAIMPFDPVCANAVIMSAPKCAESLDKLAQENDAVRRALYSLTQTTAIGAVLVAHMPIVLAVVMHHVPAAQNMMGAMGQQMAENIARQMNADGPAEEPPVNE